MVVYSACFLSSRFTVLCVVGAVVAHELPLLYDAHARAQSIAADSLSAVLIFGSLAFVVVVGRVLLARVSEEHAVMRELATAVASGMAPADVFVLASRRIATLLGVDGCGIVEFASSESAVVGGAWARNDAPRAGARDHPAAHPRRRPAPPLPRRARRARRPPRGEPSAPRAWATAAR